MVKKNLITYQFKLLFLKKYLYFKNITFKKLLKININSIKFGLIC